MAAVIKDRRINTDKKARDDGDAHLPHERDEAPDGKDHPPRAVMQQAAADLARGLVDTDLHGLRGVEKVLGKSPPRKK